MKPKPSIVADRVADFIGRTVAIRVTWAELELVGALTGLVPLGRVYLLAVTVDGRKRLIATNAVLELAEVLS